LSQTHTHTFYLAVPNTPMWGKTIAAATDLSFQAATKESPPSVQGLYACNGPPKVSSVQPI